MRKAGAPWFDDSVSRENLRTSNYRNYGYIRRRSPLGVILRNTSLTGKIITANVVFFIVAYLRGALDNLECSGTICEYIALQPNNFLLKGYVWTLLTSMFMHGGFAHLFINMFVLFSLGMMSEKIIGRKRFFWFYMLSGIFAGLTFVFLAYFFGNSGLGGQIFSNPKIYAVGASGAIFAIAGLFVILTPRLRFYIIFFPFFSLPAYVMVPLVLVLTWLVSSASGLAIGNTAHFGGFLAGIAYGLYLKNKYRKKARLISSLFSG